MTTAERMRRYGFRRSRFFGWIITYKRRWIAVDKAGFEIAAGYYGDRDVFEPAKGRSVVALALLAKSVARKLARQGNKCRWMVAIET